MRKSALVVWMAWVSVALGSGGEGPVPTPDVTSQLISKLQVIRAPRPVKELTAWGGSEQLFFHDGATLFQMSLLTHDWWALGASQGGLTPLDGEGQEHIVGKGGLWFSLSTRRWTAIPGWPKGGAALFWERNELFSLEQSGTLFGKTVYEVRAHREGGARDVCRLVFPRGEKPRLARGHRYPYLAYYLLDESGGRLKATVRLVNLSDCRDNAFAAVPLKGVKESGVREAFVFPTQSAVALWADRGIGEEIRWQQGGKEYWLSLGGETALAPSVTQPMLVVGSTHGGVEVILPAVPVRAKLLSKFKTGQLTEANLWLSEEGTAMLVSSYVEGWEGHALYRVDLNPGAAVP